MLTACPHRRNLNYFSSAYTAAVSAVDPDAGHGELVIKVPSELWKQGDGNGVFCQVFCVAPFMQISAFTLISMKPIIRTNVNKTQLKLKAQQTFE